MELYINGDIYKKLTVLELYIMELESVLIKKLTTRDQIIPKGTHHPEKRSNSIRNPCGVL